MFRNFTMAAAISLLSIFGSAQAATVTETYKFSLGGFKDADGGVTTPNLSSLAGSFTITFDPTQLSSNVTTGISLNFVGNPIALGSALGYSEINTSPPVVFVGGVANSSGYLDTPAPTYTGVTNDVVLGVVFIGGNLNAPSFVSCATTGVNCGVLTGTSAFAAGYDFKGGDPFLATSASISAVPEPSTWAMMILGFCGLGFATYRRHQSSTAFAA